MTDDLLNPSRYLENVDIVLQDDKAYARYNFKVPDFQEIRKWGDPSKRSLKYIIVHSEWVEVTHVNKLPNETFFSKPT